MIYCLVVFQYKEVSMGNEYSNYNLFIWWGWREGKLPLSIGNLYSNLGKFFTVVCIKNADYFVNLLPRR